MRRLLPLLPVAFWMLSSSAHAAMELSKYPRVYKGGEGLVVKVVSVKGEKKQALVQLSGVDTELDGVVLLTEEVSAGKGTALKTVLHGEDVWVMDVYLPETPTKPTNVHYDEKESKKVKGDAMLKTYEKQKKDGSLAKLQAFNRADREKAQNKSYAEEIKSTADACGFKVPAAIDWKSVSDQLFKDNISIHGYCSPPLSALRRLCDKSPALKAAVKSKVKSVGCRFASAMKLTLGANGVVSWITAKDSSNQDDYAQANLENALN